MITAEQIIERMEFLRTAEPGLAVETAGSYARGLFGQRERAVLIKYLLDPCERLRNVAYCALEKSPLSDEDLFAIEAVMANPGCKSINLMSCLWRDREPELAFASIKRLFERGTLHARLAGMHILDRVADRKEAGEHVMQLTADLLAAYPDLPARHREHLEWTQRQLRPMAGSDPMLGLTGGVLLSDAARDKARRPLPEIIELIKQGDISDAEVFDHLLNPQQATPGMSPGF